MYAEGSGDESEGLLGGGGAVATRWAWLKGTVFEQVRVMYSANRAKTIVLARSFFNPMLFSKPADQSEALVRIRANWSMYKLFYGVVYVVVLVYTILSSPLLLLGLAASAGSWGCGAFGAQRRCAQHAAPSGCAPVLRLTRRAPVPAACVQLHVRLARRAHRGEARRVRARPAREASGAGAVYAPRDRDHGCARARVRAEPAAARTASVRARAPSRPSRAHHRHAPACAHPAQAHCPRSCGSRLSRRFSRCRTR